MWGHATRERGLSLQREAEPALRLQSALEGKPCPKSRDASRRDQPTPGSSRTRDRPRRSHVSPQSPLHASSISAQDFSPRNTLQRSPEWPRFSLHLQQKRSPAALGVQTARRAPGRGSAVRGQFPPRRLPPEEPGRAQEWRASAAAPPRSNAFYPQVYRWILNTFPSPRPFLYSLKYFYWA